MVLVGKTQIVNINTKYKSS